MEVRDFVFVEAVFCGEIMDSHRSSFSFLRLFFFPNLCSLELEQLLSTALSIGKDLLQRVRGSSWSSISLPVRSESVSKVPVGSCFLV